jgi:VanZ family protein
MRPLRLFKWWLALGWLVVGAIIYLSLTPHPIDIPVSSGDKMGHFLAYGLLMGWFVQLYQSRLMLALHALCFIATGVALEYLQGYTGRQFEVADMVANTGGVLLGLMLLLTPWHSLLLRWEQKIFQAR